MAQSFSQKTLHTYDKIASHFSSTHYDNSFWAKEFQIFQKLVSGKNIIDIGCGAGRDATLFVENNFNYTGIDASAGMLRQAQDRVKSARFLLMDFYHLDFPKESFDGFWASASLLHVPKRRLAAVLNQIKQIVKPQAFGFISVKKKTDMDEGLIHQSKYGGIERYFAFYDPAEIKHILENNGFTVVKHHVLVENDTRKTEWLCYFVRKT